MSRIQRVEPTASDLAISYELDAAWFWKKGGGLESALHRIKAEETAEKLRRFGVDLRPLNERAKELARHIFDPLEIHEDKA